MSVIAMFHHLRRLPTSGRLEPTEDMTRVAEKRKNAEKPFGLSDNQARRFSKKFTKS
jgi:hypothetical protein